LTAATTFTATILDDVPTANDDIFTTTVGKAVSGSLATNDTVGADAGAGATWSVASTTTANGGTVTITNPATGAYTYTPKAGYLGSDSFTYTLTDKDGDVSSATATVTVNTNGTPSISIDDNNGAVAGQVSVNEAALASGSNPLSTTEAASGTMTVSAPNGLASIDFGATNVTLAQLNALGTTPVVITMPDGTLTLTAYNPGSGAISYTYAITSPQTAPGASVTDSLSITVHDSASLTAATTFTATILDDVPTAVNDSNTVTEDSALVVTGTVLTNDTVGADANATPVTAASVTLTYGSLVLNGNGTYTYTLNNTNPTVNALTADQTLSDTYTYTITDADGDTSTAVLTITINGASDGPPTINPNDGNGAATGQATVHEIGLLTIGNTSETTTGTIAVTAPDGLSSVSVGGVTFTAAQLATPAYLASHPINTGEGTLTLTAYNAGTGAISYSYVLNAAQNQPGVTESSDTIALTVKDLAGGSSVGTLTVQIVDDVPTANDDSFTTTVDKAVSGSLATNDAVGADVGGTWSVATTTTANGGTVTITNPATGAYTYTPKAGYLGSDSFTYTLTDKDGDVSSATATVTMVDHFTDANEVVSGAEDTTQTG
ncbi:MAG: Ig-like domain-containing protein, partial [Pseudomonadota bacterium]